MNNGAALFDDNEDVKGMKKRYRRVLEQEKICQYFELQSCTIPNTFAINKNRTLKWSGAGHTSSRFIHSSS